MSWDKSCDGISEVICMWCNGCHLLLLLRGSAPSAETIVESVLVTFLCPFLELVCFCIASCRHCYLSCGHFCGNSLTMPDLVVDSQEVYLSVVQTYWAIASHTTHKHVLLVLIKCPFKLHHLHTSVLFIQLVGICWPNRRAAGDANLIA